MATLKLHNYAELTAASRKPIRPYDLPNLTSSLEESESDLDDYNESMTTSESDVNVRPLPISRNDPRQMKEMRRSLRPPCGVHAIQFSSLSTIHNNSSSFDDDEDFDDPLYAPIRKDPPLFPRMPLPPHRDTPRRATRRLTMIQELSPVMPIEDDPVIPSLRLNRDWRPQQTSTTTSVQHVLPKTNPHHKGYGVKGNGCSTPRFAVPRATRPISLCRPSEFLERPSSFYSDSGDFTTTREWEKPAPLQSRPEEFGLMGSLAKNMGIKGILFLTMAMSPQRRILTVTINNAVYFSDQKTDPTQMCSMVRLGIKRSHSHHDSRRKGRSSSRHRLPGPQPVGVRTRLVTHTNRPVFNEEFSFQLDPEYDHSRLSISVHIVNPGDTQMLGCMSFQIKRLWRKAKEDICDENSYSGVLVNDGGFFLLSEKNGERNNLPQSKVTVRKFYEAFSSTLTTSSSSLNLNSATPNKMMRDEWRVDDAGAGGISLASSSSTSFGVTDMAIPTSTSYTPRRTATMPRHDYSTESSSTGASGLDYHSQHRLTLPSITTSECDSSTQNDGPVAPSGAYGERIDYAYLYADQVPPNADPEKKRDGPSAAVRRAASFTFSPTGSANKHNRRPQQVEDEKKKKFTFGPLSKTISYIRNKMDTALSTSTLYSTKEEIRQWQHSFDSLLNHKFGCMLFQQFLKKEVSDENIDFWLACEEFKRMKEGKKGTIQRAKEIYKEYIAEQAPREVNLDSDTKAATKAALEESCRPDTFSLAQSKIEQLMSKDPYKRFVRDRLYLDLLEDDEEDEEKEQKAK